MLPYEDVLNYSSFAVFFSEQDLLRHPDQNVFDTLASMPPSEVQRLQANGRIVRRHFIYHKGKPKPGDAFDMFVSGLRDSEDLQEWANSLPFKCRSGNWHKSTIITGGLRACFEGQRTQSLHRI